MRFSITLTIEVEGAKIPLLTRLSWRRRKAQVKKRDKAICRYCGDHTPNGQVDHILPLSRGGTDNIENLAWACPGCNNSKGDMTLQEWAEATPLTQLDNQLEQRVKALHSEGLGLGAIADEVYGYRNARKTAEIKDILGFS